MGGSPQGGSPQWLQLTKAERRAAAKAAKAQAAAAQRRWQLLRHVLAGGAVLAVIVWMFVFFRGSGDPATNAAAQASATPVRTTPARTTAAATTAPATAAAATTAAANPVFPPLPEGADPALGTKPTTSAGTGQLTELRVTTLIEGGGAAARAGQRITVNYVGVSYTTGAEFDASWKRSDPFTFQLGAGQVIKGWDQGLVGVKLGSRVQIDIPSSLGYGDNPGGTSPAGPLRFIVDVLALQ